MNTDASTSSEPDESVSPAGDPVVPAAPLEPSPLPEPTPSPEPEPTATPEPEPAQVYPPSFGFIDAHADTISRALLYGHVIRSLYDSDFLHVDFKRLSEYDAPVQVFAAWLPDFFVPEAFDVTNFLFDFFEEEVEKHSDIIEIAHDLDDIRRIAGEGKISAILAIEGGEALEGKIENLEHFYNRGVRILTLAWNRENELGHGLYSSLSGGLKPFGFEVIKKMEELGMIMDVSHLNEAGFWDAHKTSTRPYIASHSNSYSIMQHPRNLNDEQITAIVESGGIIGFNMYPTFIGPGEIIVVDDIFAHLHHFIQIGAGDHIGLGCDYDGITSTPVGLKGVQTLKWLGEMLAEEFDEETSHKILERNFYEFFKRYFESRYNPSASNRYVS